MFFVIYFYAARDYSHRLSLVACHDAFIAAFDFAID